MGRTSSATRPPLPRVRPPAGLRQLAADSLELLSAALFDPCFPALFDLRVWGSIIGMFELNNLNLFVPSPVTRWRGLLEALPEGEQAEVGEEVGECWCLGCLGAQEPGKFGARAARGHRNCWEGGSRRHAARYIFHFRPCALNRMLGTALFGLLGALREGCFRLVCCGLGHSCTPLLQARCWRSWMRSKRRRAARATPSTPCRSAWRAALARVPSAAWQHSGSTLQQHPPVPCCLLLCFPGQQGFSGQQPAKGQRGQWAAQVGPISN